MCRPAQLPSFAHVVHKLSLQDKVVIAIYFSHAKQRSPVVVHKLKMLYWATADGDRETGSTRLSITSIDEVARVQGIHVASSVAVLMLGASSTLPQWNSSWYLFVDTATNADYLLAVCSFSSFPGLRRAQQALSSSKGSWELKIASAYWNWGWLSYLDCWCEGSVSCWEQYFVFLWSFSSDLKTQWSESSYAS